MKKRGPGGENKRNFVLLFVGWLIASQAIVGAAEEIHVTAGELRLNELLASNRTGRVDDEGQTSDWLELHNAGEIDLRLGGYFLTDDLEDLTKWPFPDQRITGDGYLLVWMSGLGRQSLAPEALLASGATIPFEETLIKPGANWKYISQGPADDAASAAARTPSNWMSIDFDASEFLDGPAGFGYGDEDDATQLPAGTTVVLVRHEFTLEKQLASEALVLQVDYDDGFVAYLNGTRVMAVNAPPEEPGLASMAHGGHDAGLAERFDLSQHVGLLRVGKNVLALAGLNNSASSSDLSLDPALGTLPPVCHATFRLKKKGGALYLVTPEGRVADQIEYPKQISDQSLGRSVTPEGSWGYFLTPTPGGPNTGPQQSQPIKSRISLIPKPGSFSEDVEVRMADKSSAAVEIRYTRDGSVPDGTSPLFRDPLLLSQTSLLRAAAFVGQERASPVVSSTYLLGERAGLPVLSLAMEPAHFLDVHLQSGATGRGSERPAFLELFDANGQRQVATRFGLRLHGGAGRRGGLETKKSYRTYFRKSYGMGRVKYPIIPEAGVKDFDKLVLRANFGDRVPYGAYIRDQVIRDVHADMGGLASSGAWYVMLINGVSHGVYNVTERMDEEFFASHVGEGEYDIMKTNDSVLSGTREDWDDLRNFIAETDFADDGNFSRLAQRVDLENFTSYVIVNLCLQNLDWPHNNWYAARRVPDGKWMFLCWDAEWGLGGGPYGPEVDPYAYMDSGGGYGFSLTRQLFFALLGNRDYCDYYQREVRRHLEGGLATENILRHIRRHRDTIATEIGVEYRARGHEPREWHQRIREVEEFAQHCGTFFQQYTDQYFAHKISTYSETRVGFHEASDGRRYVIYATDEGVLREISCSADGSVVAENAISMPDGIPPAVGRLSLYALPAGPRRIIYRDAAGRLHEFTSPANASATSFWGHTDLTALMKLPVAGCDPSLVVAEGVPHLVYVDPGGQIHECWFEGTWRHHPLPAAPRAAGEAMISYGAAALHVTYRTMFGSVCEQALLLRDAENLRRRWTHRLIYGLPAAGRPRGFSPHGIRHVVFRPADKWPLQEPFVSGVNTVRRREQSLAAIDEVTPNTPQEESHNVQESGSVAGDAFGSKYRDASKGGWFSYDLQVLPADPVRLWVTYWGGDGGNRIFDILIDGQHLVTQKLTGTQPRRFREVGYDLPTSLTEGKQQVTVRFQAHQDAVAGGVYGVRILPRHELVHAWYDGNRFWHLRGSGKPGPPALGDPCVCHDPSESHYYFAYRNKLGHIEEATFVSDETPQGGTWERHNPLVLAASPLAAGDPAGLVSLHSGNRYYVYRGQDGNFHELCFDGEWHSRNLTALAADEIE